MNSSRGFPNPLLYTTQKEHPNHRVLLFCQKVLFVQHNEKTVFFRFCAHLFVPLHPIMQTPTGYIEDEVYGQRLLISVNADPRELQSNIRAARAILHSFADVSIIINSHTMSFGHKNPEYTIDGQLGDRKGIMGEKGVTAGFKAAKKQGCKIVVIDLDEHILQVRSFELSKYISRRKADFVSGMIAACYVVYDGEAVVVNASIQTRQEIMSAIEMLNPGTSSY